MAKVEDWGNLVEVGSLEDWDKSKEAKANTTWDDMEEVGTLSDWESKKKVDINSLSLAEKLALGYDGSPENGLQDSAPIGQQQQQDQQSNFGKMLERVNTMTARSGGGLIGMAAEKTQLPDWSFRGNETHAPIWTAQGISQYALDSAEALVGYAVDGWVNIADTLTDGDVRQYMKQLNKDLTTESDSELQRENLQYEGNEFEKFGWEVAEGVTNMIPALGAGYVSKKPQVAFAVIAGQVGGDKYAEYMEKTKGDHVKAMAAAKFAIAAEALPEMIPVTAALRKAGAGEGVSRFLETTFGEAFQEGLTELLTSVYDDTQLESMSLKDAILNIDWSQVGHAALLGGAVGAIIGLPGTIADYAASRGNKQGQNENPDPNNPANNNTSNNAADLLGEDDDGGFQPTEDVKPSNWKEQEVTFENTQYQQPGADWSSADPAATQNGLAVEGVDIPQPAQQSPQTNQTSPRYEPEQNVVGNLNVSEIPVDALTLSEDVPQFKDGANDKGIVEELGGKFDRRGVAPIQVWEREDGRLEVISGRHRLDLARRSGEETIPAQVHREVDGFDGKQASMLDAELNIRDNQGSVKDYVQYFKESGITEEEANNRGLLSRTLGNRSWKIADRGSEETIAAHRAAIISDEAAERIAVTAPNDGKLQAVGLDALQKGKSITHAVNMMQAVTALGGDPSMDMFGFDDSAMKAAESMAKLASKKQREISDKLRPQKAVSKAGDKATSEGINDTLSEKDRQKRIQELSDERARWDNWSTDPELVSQLRAETGLEQSPEQTNGIQVDEPVEQFDNENQNGLFDEEETTVSDLQPSSDTKTTGVTGVLAADNLEGSAETDGDAGQGDVLSEQANGLDFGLTTQTEEDLRKRDDERKAAEEAEKQAEAKAKADKEVDQFDLTGSDRKRDENVKQQTDLLLAAEEAATSPTNDHPEPTDKQKEAGNYKKGHYKINGMDVSIENPAGSKRQPEWPELKDHYGDFKRTVGAEGVKGEGVDAFFNSEATDAEYQERPVFVVDQHKKNGDFDEHKVIVGAKDADHALKIYKRNYSKGWTGGKNVTEMSWDDFKTWVKDENNTSKAAFSEEKSDTGKAEQGKTENKLSEDKKPSVSANTVFTEDAAAKARELLRKKLGQLSMGLDPELLQAGITLAGYHIEKGSRTFAAYSKAMIADLGDVVRPYLKSWYMAVKYDPRAAGFNSEMDSAEVVEKATTDQVQGNPFVTAYHQALRDGTAPKNNNELRKFVRELDGKEPSQARMKEAQEGIEVAMVLHARDIVVEGGGVKTVFNKLVDDYNNQPLLNIRTSTSVQNQAYSTPAPIAYLASELARITINNSVYEPTAGNGMLLIGADPDNVIANELNPDRVEGLRQAGYSPTQGDALTAIENGIVSKGSVDAVITNPPFGGLDSPTKKDGYKITKIDHLIAAESLDAMKDDGRAVLIIGANKQEGVMAETDRIFFNWLYSHYNVADNFEIDGKLYNRQGAGWPIRVITIAGRSKSDKISPDAATIDRVSDWNELFRRFETSSNLSKDVVVSRDSKAGDPALDGGKDTAGSGNDSGSVLAADGGQNSGTRGEATGVGRPGGRGNTGTRGSSGKRSDNNGRPDNADGRNDVPVEQNQLEQGNEQAGSEQVPTENDGGKSKPRRPVAVDESVGSDYQVSYTSKSQAGAEGVLVPVNMSSAISKALDDIDEKTGGIDAYVQDRLGYKTREEMNDALMGLQIDSIASAIYNIEKGEGIIIADQTGIGKGRQAAAILRYAKRQGKIPVFITVKADLFTDMYGDLQDIGSGDSKPLLMNSDASITDRISNKIKFKNKAGQHKRILEQMINDGSLPNGSDMLFLTYSQINKPNTQQQVLNAIADKAIFVLDESHNAGGESNTGIFMQGVLSMSPGVTYLSATYAKRPDNLPVYLKTSISKAVDGINELVHAVTAGGLGLQTVISNMLTEAGQLFRRERSYQGVEILTKTDTKNKAKHTKLADSVTERLRLITEADELFHNLQVKHMDKEAKKAGKAIAGAGNRSQAGVDHSKFSSVAHNAIRQFVLSLKADTAADDAIEALKRGEKPVIALENTMGSFLSEYVADNGIANGEELDDFNYRTVLTRALDRSRRITIKDVRGNKTTVDVPLSDLHPDVYERFMRAQAAIDALEVEDIPVSPIDWIRHRIEKEGFSVKEITGREWMVDYSTEGSPTLTRKSKEELDRVKSRDDFNNGSLDSIILNVAGSTGISLHASEKFKDQRQRHMIVAQAALDINVFMQMLGRVHRTGQVRVPRYSILNLDIPAEIRPTAVLSKKMKSLNANTSSNTDSDTSVNALDLFNKYGDQVMNEYLNENPSLAIMLNLYDVGPSDGDLSLKVTGRMALLPVQDQINFYNDIEPEYRDYIEYLDRTGQNDLDIKTVPLDAKEIESGELSAARDESNIFGQSSTLTLYDTKRQGKPMMHDEIEKEIDRVLDGKTADQYSQDLIDSMRKVEDELIAKERGVIEKYQAELRDKPGLDVNQKKGLTLAIENARSTITKLQTGRENMERVIGRDLKIGNMVRLQVGEQTFVGVVGEIIHKHKSGSPYAYSKTKVTFYVNDASRTLRIPLSKLYSSTEPVYIGQELLQTVPEVFNEEAASNSRENRYIVTGNLLSAYSELKSSGQVISFSTSDGEIKQGILLPRSFTPEDHLAKDVSMRDPSGAVRFLLEHQAHPEIYRGGIATRDGVVRVVAMNGNIRIQVPKAKNRGGAWFLDQSLIDITGDFVSQGSLMMVDLAPAEAIEAIRYISAKSGLYAPESYATLARPYSGIQSQGNSALSMQSSQANAAQNNRPQILRRPEQQSGAGSVRAATNRAPVAQPSTGDAIADAGLVITKTKTNNGKDVWEVTGNTMEHKDIIKSLGGRWYGPKKAWSFYNEDPTAALTEKLGGAFSFKNNAGKKAVQDSIDQAQLVDTVAGFLDDLTLQDKVRSHIYATPEHFIEALRRKGYRINEKEAQNALGFMHGNNLYIIASNVPTQAAVLPLLRHEVVVHYGLSTMRPEDKAAILKKIINSRFVPGMREIWKEIDKTYRHKYPDGVEGSTEKRAEEVFARVAEMDPDRQPKVWEKIVDLVMKALRKVGIFGLNRDGFKNTYTVTEARAYIKDIAQNIRNGETNNSDEFRAMVAWHGSPHDHDGFDSSKIGTGEGAQAYGWGHYFASKKEVAEWYRKNLSRPMPLIDGESNFPMFSTEQHILTQLSYRDQNGDVQDTIDEMIETYQVLLDMGDITPVGEKMLDWLKTNRHRVSRSAPGKLYQVDLKPSEDEYLLWDENLRDHTGVVKQILKNLFSTDDGKMNYLRGTGKTFYYGLGESFLRQEPWVAKWIEANSVSDLNINAANAQKFASMYLNSIGIRGIKYLDGSSRNRPIKEIKKEFLAELPEDAEIDEVMELHKNGHFSPQYANVIEALNNDDWLGFDYPAQAISAIYRDIQNYDPSPELVSAVEETKKDGTYNYVIFDDADIEITGKFDLKPDVENKQAKAKGLPMDKESRLKRARKMGFDTDTVWYHGTDKEFESFSKEKINSRFPYSFGFHFTDRKTEADAYTEEDRKTLAGGQIYPVYLRYKNPLVIDTKEIAASMEADFNRGEIIRKVVEAKREGKPYDAVVINRNKGDEWDGSNVIVFEPNQIRSIHAAFDPEYSDNPELMASLRPEENGHAERSILRAILDSQPVDKIFRAPFKHILGGLDAHGRYKPGKIVADEVKKTIVDRKTGFDRADGFIETLRHGIIDRYKTPQAFIDREQEAIREQRKHEMKAVDFIKQLQDHVQTPEEWKMIKAMLEGEDVGQREWSHLKEPIRRAIDELGQDAVNLGLISGETYERHKGAYLHRVYMKHEARTTGLGKVAAKMSGGLRKKIQGSALKRRGMSFNIDQDRLLRDIPHDWFGVKKSAKTADKRLVNQEFVLLELHTDAGERNEQMDIGEGGSPRKLKHRVWWPVDKPIPTKFAEYDNRGVWTVINTSGGKLTVWRDYTKDERMKMGEILDARYVLAKTFHVMAHDISTARFFDDIAKNTEWVWQDNENPPDPKTVDEANRPRIAARYRTWANVEWVKVPDTTIKGTHVKAYGALAGKYIKAELWRDLQSLEAMHNPGWWSELLKFWKLNKTSRNPVVHLNNIMSNVALMDLIDVRTTDFFDGLKEYHRQGEVYQEALDHGAFGNSFVSQEIRDQVLNPVLKELMREAELQHETYGDIQGFGHFYNALEKAIKGIKGFDDWMVSVYQLEDEFFRMATYMRRRGLGDSPAEAAHIARNQFLNYDIRAPWINAARRSVLPFISYSYRAIPAIAESIAHRPWKLAKYFTVMYGLNMLAYMATGDDDEEEKERASMDDRKQGYTWLGVPRMIRMPFVDDNDNPTYLDVRRWIPAGDVFDMNQGAVPYMPAWLQMGGPILIAGEIVANKNTYFDKEIYNKEVDTLPEMFGKSAWYAAQSIMPSAPYIPGSHYFNQILEASMGATDWKGIERSVGQSMASSVGIKVQSLDVDSGFAYQQMAIERQKQAFIYELKQLERQYRRNEIFEWNYERQKRNLEGKIDILIDRAMELRDKAG